MHMGTTSFTRRARMLQATAIDPTLPYQGLLSPKLMLAC